MYRVDLESNLLLIGLDNAVVIEILNTTVVNGNHHIQMKNLKFNQAGIFMKAQGVMSVEDCHFDGVQSGITDEQSSSLKVANCVFTNTGLSISKASGNSLMI